MIENRITGFVRFQSVQVHVIKRIARQWKDSKYGPQFVTIDVAPVFKCRNDFVLDFTYILGPNESISQFLHVRNKYLRREVEEDRFKCSVAAAIFSL